MNRIQVAADRMFWPPDQVYRGEGDSGWNWRQILVLDFTGCEIQVSSIKKCLEKWENACHLVLDNTNIKPDCLLSILKAWRKKQKLNFISALDDRYDRDQSIVDSLVEHEDKLAEELKKNANIYSLDLINDEDKQNLILQKKLNLNWRNNIKWCFHRFNKNINIKLIKACRLLCRDESNDLEESKIIRSHIPRTLKLTDDLFMKDCSQDFIFYLSQEDHTIAEIDATQISDSQMK